MSRHRHHRHHRPSSNGSTADRAAKLKAHKAALIERTGFSEFDPRIEQGAWLLLAEDVIKESLLRGEAVPIEAMRPVTDMLASILPVESKTLEVRFVEGFICPRCQADTTAEAAAAAAEAKAAPMAAPQPVAAPPVPATSAPVQPAPNVVNIHSHPLAPLAKYNEPWRGFTEDNGRTGYGGFDNNG